MRFEPAISAYGMACLELSLLALDFCKLGSMFLSRGLARTELKMFVYGAVCTDSFLLVLDSACAGVGIGMRPVGRDSFDRK